MGLEQLRCDFRFSANAFLALQGLDLQAWPIDQQEFCPTNSRLRSTNGYFRFSGLRCGGAWGTSGFMALVIAFLLGMGNFACHRAVIASGHRMLTEMPPATLQAARISSLVLEFCLLCGALYAARAGATQWIWLYAGYSAINAWAAWSIVNRRI